ncbi:MAG: dodecin domain-containing protein [Deltaproteobacteria bacterium]|nr:dodecin domain-containing protein [Deltaproteobacteria bacterium]MCB9787274.1 dodecin domain-containing protein [Deltaproteobacteria bacterium]
MSVAKSIEISSTSPKGFEDAIRRGLERTGKSLNDIRSAWIKDQQVNLQNGQVHEYQVNMKVTFVVGE